MRVLDRSSDWMPDHTVERIRRALERPTTAVDTPPEELQVSGLEGFGEAGCWARRCLFDLDAFQARRIDWRDVDSRTVIDDRDDLDAIPMVRRFAEAAGMPLHHMGPSAFVSGTGTGIQMTARLHGALTSILEGPPAVIVIELPDTGSGLESPFAQALADALPNRETTEGFPVVTIRTSSERIRPSLLRPERLGLPTRMAYPTAVDLAWMLSRELGELHPVASILRSVRHLEGVATHASMARLATKARRLAGKGDRPVRIEDVASAAFDDRRSAEERLRVALDVASRVVADLLDGHVPTFASVLGVVLPDRRTEGYDTLGSCYAGQEICHDPLVRSLVGRAAMDLLFGREVAEYDRIGQDGATPEARCLYAYADARRIVTMWTDEIGELTAMLLEQPALDRTEISDFASRTELGPDAAS